MPHNEPNSVQHEVIAELNNKYGVLRWEVQQDLSVKIELETGPWKVMYIDTSGDEI